MLIKSVHYFDEEIVAVLHVRMKLVDSAKYKVSTYRRQRLLHF